MKNNCVGAGFLLGWALAAVLALGATTVPAAAQSRTPSAAADAMAGSHVARVRGFAAVVGNPGRLGIPGGPARSATIMSLSGFAGLDPIGLGDLAPYGGEPLSLEVREDWLTRIEQAGGEEGAAGADVTFFAIQAGRFGMHFSTAAYVAANLAPGAAELVLFGNAGRTGSPADISLAGSSLDAVLTSSVAVAYAHPLVSRPGRSIALGGAVRYTMGHILLSAVDANGAATTDPLAIGVTFPIVQSGERMVPITDRRGSGWGLDLGIAWEENDFSAGLTVRDLVSSFEWDPGLLAYRPGTISVTDAEWETDFEVHPYSEAPAELRQRVRDHRPAPVVTAGVAYAPAADWLVSADVRQRLGDDPRPDPAFQLGAGAEYRPLAWLPLRAGAGVVSGGYLLSTGLGLEVSSVVFDAAIARRQSDVGVGTLASFTFSFGIW